jgi:hypothetical protein
MGTCENLAGCPDASGTTIAGPHEQYGFCWYLSAGGVNCDTACADLGGTNLALTAESAWADNCGGPAVDDISYWFRNNGNPGSWTGTGSTSYHTLGYGYRSGAYYGKCSRGTATGNGAYPGDPNNDTDRSVVCACF